MDVRSYTLGEIDRMRAALFERAHRKLSLDYYYRSPSHEETLRIEDRLRTYMTAGIEPSEVEHSANEAPYNKDVIGDRSDWKWEVV